MNHIFRATVSALCYSLLEPAFGPGELDTETLNKVVHFVLAQHKSMPDFLRFPLKVVTFGFFLENLFMTGSLFHRQTRNYRRSRVLAWKHSRIGPKRDFIKFFESLAWLAWHGNLAFSQSSQSPNAS